jgi:hypothetical protein
VATILASTTRLVANRAAWADPAKRSKIEDVALLLLGAIEGRNKVRPAAAPLTSTALSMPDWMPLGAPAAPSRSQAAAAKALRGF